MRGYYPAGILSDEADQRDPASLVIILILLVVLIPHLHRRSSSHTILQKLDDAIQTPCAAPQRMRRRSGSACYGHVSSVKMTNTDMTSTSPLGHSIREHVPLQFPLGGVFD